MDFSTIIPNYSRKAKKINIPSKKDKLFQDHQQNAFSISSTPKKGQKVPRVKIKWFFGVFNDHEWNMDLLKLRAKLFDIFKYLDELTLIRKRTAKLKVRLSWSVNNFDGYFKEHDSDGIDMMFSHFFRQNQPSESVE